eukprot:gene55297-75788_t
MGAATDLTNVGLRRMVINAVLWGFDLPIPAETDVRYVDDFAPAPYAFKGYRRGLTPDDHALGQVLRPGAFVPAPEPFSLLALLASASAAEPKPLRVLLITGGCCHDYAFQASALVDSLKKHGPVACTIVNEGGTAKNAKIKLYEDPNWAKAYEVVIHNECFADLADPDYTRKITAAHKAGTPAVVIHCAMHTYRTLAVDDWREFLGVTSRKHDHQAQYAVTPTPA